MKYIARVCEVLRPGIHEVARIEDGDVSSLGLMSLPDRVEIETIEDGDGCMMYRYTRSGDVCGDTWHESLESAFGQAKFEYGLRREDFLVLHEGSLGSQV